MNKPDSGHWENFMLVTFFLFYVNKKYQPCRAFKEAPVWDNY